MLANNLDGLDLDLENFSPGISYPQAGLLSSQVMTWLTDVSVTARSLLGSGRLLTHAPQAPYFGPVSPNGAYQYSPVTGTVYWTLGGGGYTALWQALGSSGVVDAFLVQFYNQVRIHLIE